MSRDPMFLTWGEKTLRERFETALSWVLALVMAAGITVGALLALAAVEDGTVRYHEYHERCLKQATNGYEIRECH